jgi:hypothetical protein
MTTINVQFVDSTKTAIQTVFSSPQEEKEYVNLGTVETGDAIYAAWYGSLPLNVQAFWQSPDPKSSD